MRLGVAVFSVMVLLCLYSCSALRNPRSIGFRRQARVSTGRALSSKDRDGSSMGAFPRGGDALLSGLSMTGALETALLSYSKATGAALPGASVFCAVNGASSSCGDVLNGPYSEVPGTDVPLVAIACVGYSLVAVLSALRSTRDDPTRQTLVLGTATAMGTFSVYLLLLLSQVLHAQCNYCYLSAALSISMAIVASATRVVSDEGKARQVSLSSAVATAVASAGLFFATGAESAQASTAPAAQALAMQRQAATDERALIAAADKSAKKANYKRDVSKPSTARTFNDMAKEENSVFAPPLVSSASSAKALAVGDRLQKKGATMYGAYWCSHCNNQKQALGKEVYEKKQFRYVECDKQGEGSQDALCKANKGVPGYPTWEIGGNYYPGEKSVDELAVLLDTLDK